MPSLYMTLGLVIIVNGQLGAKYQENVHNSIQRNKLPASSWMKISSGENFIKQKKKKVG